MRKPFLVSLVLALLLTACSGGETGEATDAVGDDGASTTSTTAAIDASPTSTSTTSNAPTSTTTAVTTTVDPAVTTTTTTAAVTATTSPAPTTTTSTAAPASTTTAPATTTTAAPTTTTTTTTSGPSVLCVVWLHGKGGSGWASSNDGTFQYVAPTGNGSAWGGSEWRYDSGGAYTEAVGIIRAAVDADGCTSISVHGFSNGAAMAAKLFCSGETFDGRLRGVVVDDPVPDHGTAGCAPASGVQVKLYWTGDLAWATAGTDCGSIDWTCEGGSILGIDATAANLGTPITASPHTSHQWNFNATEPYDWLL